MPKCSILTNKMIQERELRELMPLQIDYERSPYLIDLQEKIITSAVKGRWERVIFLSRKYSAEYKKFDPDYSAPSNFHPILVVFTCFSDPDIDVLDKIKILKAIDDLNDKGTRWNWKEMIAEQYELLRESNKSKIDNYESEIKKKKTIKTLSGIKVQSEGERKIADFLFSNKIDYDYDKVITLRGNENNDKGYKESWIRPDFYLTEFDIVIEYWGLKGKANYDTKMNAKKRLYKESGKRFISITPEQLKDLAEILSTKLTRVGCKIESLF
jgi:hypothetical protein